MPVADVHYAWNGDVALAYEVFGAGPVDLLYLQGYASHIDMNWQSPYLARFLRGMGAQARVIHTDRRGWGCSDRFSPGEVAPLEVQVDDVVAVLGCCHEFLNWFVPWCRSAVAPGALTSEADRFGAVDVRGVLSSIHAPTVVVGRPNEAPLRARHWVGAAEGIRGARLLEPPNDGDIGPFHWYGRAPAVLQAISDLLADIDDEQPGARKPSPRPYAILGWRYASWIHTGEVETINDKVGGIAVHVGARIGAMAGPSQILVSSTVKDLTLGSGITFADTGDHELKGVPDRWHVYSVMS